MYWVPVNKGCNLLIIIHFFPLQSFRGKEFVEFYLHASVCVCGVLMRLSENYTVFPKVENSCLYLEAVSVALQLRKLCFSPMCP